MRTAVDTNVLCALWSAEPIAGQMVELLAQARSNGGVVICGAVYAELQAHPNVSGNFVDSFLQQTNIRVDFDVGEALWRAAAGCFASYAKRRRSSGGQEPKRLLVDFLVGAHAMISADRLLSLDRGRYATAFPDLLILPDLPA